jgi:hypothetical protein
MVNGMSTSPCNVTREQVVVHGESRAQKHRLCKVTLCAEAPLVKLPSWINSGELLRIFVLPAS